MTFWHDHRRNDEFAILARLIISLEEKIMSSFDDVKAAQAATDAKIDAVTADVKTLMDKIANMPAAGLTADQQAALDDIATHAQAINDRLSGIDATVNPPAAVEPPPAA
jgi:hypothetical protein